jgi:Domain of unknown function (DUF4406)
MRGRPFLNFAAFDEAAACLVEQGHTPISPADNSRRLVVEAGLDPTVEASYSRKIPIETYMEDDIISMRHAEAVVVLPGWRASKGVRVELAYAAFRGIPVYTLADFLLLDRIKKAA